MKQRKQELPYFADTAALFDGIADWRWAVFLDSGQGGERPGRYDIFSAEPMVTLVTRGDTTRISTPETFQTSADDPFALLRSYLEPIEAPDHDLPFNGGALGYFGYDLGRRIEKLPDTTVDDEQLPEMAIGIYDWAVIVDHRERRSWLVSAGRDSNTPARWNSLVALFSYPSETPLLRDFGFSGELRSDLPYQNYAAGFKRIKSYIHEGDCYQVNYAQRFAIGFEGDAWAAFRQYRSLNPAPFSAYLNLPFVNILSASPERFIRVAARHIITQPIKGTAPRSEDLAVDEALAKALEASDKDRAENVMIVDLLRNDLGKNSELFSVKVPQLYALQSFATVHHLVSTVTGKLEPDKDALDLLRGCFPGGSITGAPKIRAMEVIDEVEVHRRGVYCGSIGYISYHGIMDTSVVIRTITVKNREAHYWAGGGIVVDSDLDGEYQESLDKARALRQLIGDI